MIHILHDTPEGYPFIAERLTLPCVKHYSPQFKHKYLTWIAGAWSVVRKSKKGDLILSVYDFQGILCYWIGLLTFHRRKILGINILLKKKKSFRNKIATSLYRHALKSRWFFTTATTEEYSNDISSHLGLKKNIPVLHDVLYQSYLTDAGSMRSSENGYVFIGGRNGRDWNFTVRLAKAMPDIEFRLSLPSSIKERLEATTEVPTNIVWHCDVSYAEFSKLILEASIVALPLDTESPAGLIVLFQAAAAKKTVIITKTVSTEEYVSDDRGYALNNDIEKWENAINILISDSEKRKMMAEKLSEYLIENCNEEKYVAEIDRIIHNILQY